MKKRLLLACLMTYLFSLSFVGLKTNANSMNIVDFLTQERIVMTEGIELHKRTALTAFNGNLEDKRPQNIQALIRPGNSEATKVVNWSKGTDGNWGLYTVAQIAQDYEAKHPGWIVLGAVNGDFYGINPPDLHYGETNNTNVGSGMVFKPEVTGGMSVIGLKEDGSYVYGKPTHSATMTLSVYDSLDQIIAEFPINKINQSPNANEISIIMNDIADPTTIQTEQAKVISFTNQMFRRTYDNDPSPSRAHRYLTTGIVSTIVDGAAISTLSRPDFKLVSRSENLNQVIASGQKIVAQHKLTGAFAGVTDATGYSHQVLINGVPQLKDSKEAYVLAPNPRTAIGFKADGTIILLMVDGRASTEQRNGITMFELGELLRRYDCVDGFNLDGGGSSSLVVRNDAGGFTTVNYPSDGFDRRVANALLIVTRAPGIEIEEIGDTYVKVTNKQPNVANQGVISNVRVTIDGETRTMVGNELIFDGLTTKMDYVLNYTYDIVEPNQTLKALGHRMNFTTGKIKPSIEAFHFMNPNASNVTINFDINDPDQAIISKKIVYGDSEVELSNLVGQIIIDDFPKGEAVNYQLVIEYSYGTGTDATYTVESNFITTTKQKSIPSIVSFSLGQAEGETLQLNYELNDADLAIVSKSIKINNVNYQVTTESFLFEELIKGTTYQFQLVVEYKRTTSSEPITITSNQLTLARPKDAPTIDQFKIITLESGETKIVYSVTDVDAAVMEIAIVKGTQKTVVTSNSGEVALTDLETNMEHEYKIEVIYRLLEQSNPIKIDAKDSIFIEATGLSTEAIIGIGGGSVAAIGSALFLILKRKKSLI